jgi:hypothetical protein
MSLTRRSSDNVDIAYLSSHDRVVHYLQNSKLCPTNNSLSMLQKPSSNDLFSIDNRLRLYSENDSILSSSSLSIIDELSRSGGSVQSSLSDPVATSSISSSNVSSSLEELDFNIGFYQFSNDEDNQHISNKNNAGMNIIMKYMFISSGCSFSFLDAATLLGEAILEARINEFEEFLRQSSNSTGFNDDDQFNNEDTVTASYTKQPKRGAFLYDSTHTLCSEDCFLSYTEDDNDDQESEQITVRSNSLNVHQFDGKSTLLQKAPKKMVRFADVLVCN